MLLSSQRFNVLDSLMKHMQCKMLLKCLSYPGGIVISNTRVKLSFLMVVLRLCQARKSCL